MALSVLHDARYAIRSLVRRPLFTAVILLTLALGIGSNVAIFSVANTVLFRPLPFKDPEELAFVWTRLPATNVARSLVSGPDFRDYQQESTRFQGFAGAVAVPGTLTGDGDPERITNAYVTWNLFDLLGVRPVLGRAHVADDAFAMDPKAFGNPNPDLPPGKVVLSYELWQRRFGGDRSVIGRTIQMDGFGSVVVGVLPPNFRIYLPADAGMPTNIDAWGVLPSNIGDFERQAAWLTVVTRLKKGVTLAQAQQDMNGIATRLRELHQFHATQNMQIVVAGMHRDAVEHARPALLALLGAVGFVLLIACANIANLLLVRASERDREMAVRAAVGSGRGRIVAQMLTESLVLSLAGALLGVLLAWQGIGVIKALSPSNLPRIESVAIDARALAFAAGVSILAAIVFGLAPALQAVRGNLSDRLRDRGTDTGGARGNKLRTVLVVSEVALSLVLLVGAGLLVRSFHALLHTDTGLRTDGLLTAHLAIPQGKFGKLELAPRLLHPALEALRALPGVDSAGLISLLPIQQAWTNGEYAVDGEPIPDPRLAPAAEMRVTSPGTFASLGVPIIEGRDLREQDGASKEKPILVNRALVRRHFEDGRAVGRRLIIDKTPYTIVGVVGDVRQAGLDKPPLAEIDFPYDDPENAPWLNDVTLVLRGRTDPARLAGPLRETLRGLASDQPVYDVLTMDEIISRSVANRRLSLVLLSVFAAIALVLSAAGLAGVISYLVAQRTQEIGIRMALGSEPADVVRLMVRQGGRLVIAGLVLGVLGAVAVGKYLASVLAGIQAPDPLIVVLLAAVLGAIALLATYLPARRAARVDPLIAMRAE